RRHGNRHLCSYSRCISTNGPGEVLDLLLTSILERSLNLSFDLTKYFIAHQNATGLSQALKPRGDIHTVSVNISALFNDDIAKVQADAEPQRPTRSCCLNGKCCPGCSQRTCELGQKPIARRLDQPALMLGDLRLDNLPPQLLHLSECAFLVALH